MLLAVAVRELVSVSLAAVVIGRNEGARLLRCLEALKGHVALVIYVDSGSTDGSMAAATQAGAEVVELDMRMPFTAARARNAGLARIKDLSDAAFVQVIDGDCELQPGWIETAQEFLETHPDVAVVAGRLRERSPEATVWNQLADLEWDTTPGETDAVGGIAMLRSAAIEAVGGYRATLVAGEEPELCLRLRRAGWRIWRLETEMALHDIAMTRFSQWWKRARRHGYAVAEGLHLHRQSPEGFCKQQVRRALLWGSVLPLVTLLGCLITPLALLLLLAWPAQVLRLKLRGSGWPEAFFLTVAKLPETQGILSYHLAQLHKGGAW